MTGRSERMRTLFETLQATISNLMTETKEEMEDRRETMVIQQKRIDLLEGQKHRMLGRLIDIREAMKLPPDGPGIVAPVSVKIAKAYHRVQDILARES